MIPSKVNVNVPLFNNIWGELISLIGISHNKNINIQQTPDFISTLVALILICILEFRGILKVTTNSSENLKSEHRFLHTLMDLLSIIVHTLFFSILIKIFIFPNYAHSEILKNLHTNITLTVFITFTIAGMIFGAQSIAKVLLILFAFVMIFKNISFINNSLGVWGFIAILASICGFYLEFIPDSFNRKTLLLDLNFFLGRYENLELKAKKEGKRLIEGNKND